jgi:prepilin-type N-terminal cleavage/methylation domain-containing protein
MRKIFTQLGFLSKKGIENNNTGFSLIELMVSVTIFVIIVTMGIGAVITSNHAYNKTMRTSIGSDSISFVMEAMARRIRTGQDYSCDNGDCSLATEVETFQFVDQDGDTIEYSLNNGVLQRQIGLNPPQNLTETASVDISRLAFFGEGDSDSYSGGDFIQPRVTILIEGTVPLKGGATQEFRLQTSVTQRRLDLQ